MKTTLKKLSIPKPSGGFDELYTEDFVTQDGLMAEIEEFRNLVYKLHFEKDEVTEIHPFYIQSLEDENVVYDSTATCRLSIHAADVEYNYGYGWMSLSDVETIVLNKGERVYFRYVGDEYLSGGVEENYYNELKLRLTTTTKTFDVGGDVRTIVYGNTTKESISGNGLKCFFYGSNVVNADKLNMSVFKSVGQEGCYNMFSGCTSLIKAPELPATTLASSCYKEMFWNCTSLTQSQELPATTLADNCYGYMFQGCTSLTKAPELPATTLEWGCYRFMFQGCKSLTQAPELPATTLTNSCYSGMFQDCTSLTQAPELPVTTLEWGCYGSMFSGCTSLTQAPELPATTLTNSCYNSMFVDCKSLTQAPELPATTLVDRCYQNMFQGCSNLNYIKCLATDISATDCTTNWVNGVSTTGTFIKDVSLSWTVGDNGIPEGWEVKPYNAVTFTAEEAGSTIGLNKLSSYQTLEYKTAYVDWTSMSESTNITLDNIGDKMYVRGVLSGNNDASNYTQFKMTGKIAASGNCNALWDYNNLNSSLKRFCGFYMFSGCTSLKTSPELPATTLASYCYQDMFYGCTSLTTTPELPATTLVSGCYQNMFYGCTSLTTAPELPATTLADSCYYMMFDGCTSLTTAPELPATTLADSCYRYMFSGCSNLNYIKCLATDISASNCTNNWVSGVVKTGTFVKASGISWSTGTSGIPSGWEVIEE